MDATNAEQHIEQPAGPRKVAVVADNVWLKYHVPVDRGKRGLNPFGGRRRLVEAVRGVSFVTYEGEAVGLIGLNGSGKSSLLRMLAGVEPPTAGTVLTSSRPRLLGVRAALLPNLSGQENIRLGALAMGLSPAEAEAAREYVEELAGLGDRVKLPMRTYSAGMKARLKFAISMASSPEIIMIDEALTTGDASFLERTEEAMQRMLDQAGSVFLVSHAPKAIERICTRVIWIDQGQVLADGPPDGLMPFYKRYAKRMARGDLELAARGVANARKRFMPEIEDDFVWTPRAN